MTKRIPLVCLGNICRSPAAEGVLRAKANGRGLNLVIDSAGTGAWHEGSPPDARMIETTAKRGYDIGRQRARQVTHSDFTKFDYLLAMDLSNHTDLLDLAPANRSCDIRLFLDFAKCKEREMPDPYYGGGDGFSQVVDLIESGVDGFLDHLEDESE